MISSILRALALPVVGLFLLVVESAAYHILPFDWLTPDLVLPIILFLGLNDSPVSRAAPTALVLGYLMDLFGGGPIGMYSFVAVAMYLLSRTASLKLFSAGKVFQMALAFAASVLTACSIVALGLIFGQTLTNPGTLGLSLLARATFTAFASPTVFRLVRRIEPAAVRQEGSYA